MTRAQKLAKIIILRDMVKEYELLAKYNGGADYDRWVALEMASRALIDKFNKEEQENKV